MKRILTLVLLIVGITLSANAQCNVDSLQTVLDQKITEYNSANKAVDSLNAVLSPLIQKFNKENEEVQKISKEIITYRNEIDLLSRVYILNLEVNGIRTSIDNKKINDIFFSHNSGQLCFSSPEIMNEITIFDYQGSKLLRYNANDRQAFIPQSQLGYSSLYIAMIKFQNGRKISKKITIKK